RRPRQVARRPFRRTRSTVRRTAVAFSHGSASHYAAMNPRRVAWWLAASFWALFGVITGMQVWISMITHGHSIVRVIGYYFLVWEAWLAATAAVVWLARRFPVVPPRRQNVLVHFLAAPVIGI